MPYASPSTSSEWSRLYALGVNRTKLAILAAIIDRGGQGDTNQVTGDLGISHRTVQNSLNQLVAMGYLSATRPKTVGVSGSNPLVYQLCAEVIKEDLDRCYTALNKPNKLHVQDAKPV